MKKEKEITKVISFRVPLNLTNSFIEVVKDFLQKNNVKEIKPLHQLTKDETTEKYIKIISEFFSVPDNSEKFQSFELLTATEINKYIEDKSGQKLTNWKTGQILKELGYVQKVKKICGKTQRIYKVVFTT